MADFKLSFENDNWVTRSQFMLGSIKVCFDIEIGLQLLFFL